MTMQVNIGGTYKDVSSAYVNVGGVWKTANNIYTNIGGVWKDASLVNYGEYELLADIPVTSDYSTVTLTGLNIGKGDELLLVGTIIGETAYIKFNYDETDSHYYTQRIYADGTTISSTRYNSPILSTGTGSEPHYVQAKIKVTNNDYIVWQSEESRAIGGSYVRLYNNYGTISSWTASSITRIIVGYSLLTGSRIQLYKIGGAS